MKHLKALVGIVVSLVLVVLILRVVDFPRLAQILSELNYLWLIPATIMILLQFCARAVRFRYLVPHPETMGFKLSFDGTAVGNFINYILPLRAGELARPVFLSRYSTNTAPACFSALVIERFFDLACVLLIFKLSFGQLQGLAPIYLQAADALGLLALIIFAGILLATLLPETVVRIKEFLLRFCPAFIRSKLDFLVSELIKGAQTLRKPKNLLLVSVSSLLVWAATIGGYYYLLAMYDSMASVKSATIITVVIALAVAVPSAPGFIGVFQAACIAAFALLGASQTMAVSYSLIAHAQMYLLVIGYGIFILFSYKLNLADLKKRPVSKGPTEEKS